jgi:hypothetical protein
VVCADLFPRRGCGWARRRCAIWQNAKSKISKFATSRQRQRQSLYLGRAQSASQVLYFGCTPVVSHGIARALSRRAQRILRSRVVCACVVTCERVFVRHRASSPPRANVTTSTSSTIVVRLVLSTERRARSSRVARRFHGVASGRPRGEGRTPTVVAAPSSGGGWTPAV